MARWLFKRDRTRNTNWKQARRIRPTFQSLEDRQAMAAGMYLNHTSFSASTASFHDAPAITVAPSALLDVAPPITGEIVLDQQTAVIPDAPTPASPFDADEASIDFDAHFGDYQLPVADPMPEFVPETDAGGGVKILNFNTADRLQQGTFQIKARLTSATNSEAIFGTPRNQAYSVDNGYAVRQDFTKGSFLWSPDTGAHFVSAAILWKYDQIDHRFLYPATDSHKLDGWQPGSPRGGAAATFNDFFAPLKKQTMTIVSSPAGPYVIEGAIRTKWLALGAGRFGVPLLDSDAMGGGKEQIFWFRGLTRGAWDAGYSPKPGFSSYGSDDTDRAAITWHKDVGAHVVFEYAYHPKIGARFGSLDAWTMSGKAGTRPGAWGFPATDEYYVDDNGRGRHTLVTHFMNPNMSGARMAITTPFGDARDGYQWNGSYIVKGAIYGEWMRRGLPFVGLPIQEEQDLGTRWSQLFRLSETRLTQIDVHKASGTIFVGSLVKTVEGKYVLESSSRSDAFTIEEPTLPAERHVIESLASHRAPAIEDADVASAGASFLAEWSERLKLGLESQVSLFGQQWDGILLDAETAAEDDISWFTPPLDEESSEAAADFFTDTLVEDAELEIVVDEIFSDWQAEDAELNLPAPLKTPCMKIPSTSFSRRPVDSATAQAGEGDIYRPKRAHR